MDRGRYINIRDGLNQVPEVPYQADPVYPPAEFKNTYYPEPPSVDSLGGEYAPLQGQQPEIVQNEIYKMSPRFKYQLLEDVESTTPKQGQMAGPLMAGVSISAILLLICICCLIPLLCYYCLKPKSFRRRKEKVKDWLRDQFHEDEVTSSGSSEESQLPEAKKRSRSSNKWKAKPAPAKAIVNIKVNDKPIAELTVEETSTSDESESDERVIGFQQQNAVPQRLECEFTESCFEGIHAHKLKPEHVKAHAHARRQTDSKRASEINKPPSPTQSSGLRTKRHMPNPRPSDFLPPPRYVYSYEKRKPPQLTPVSEGQGGQPILTSSDDSFKPLERRKTFRNSERLRSSSQQDFYENHMTNWGKDGA